MNSSVDIRKVPGYPDVPLEPGAMQPFLKTEYHLFGTNASTQLPPPAGLQLGETLLKVYLTPALITFGVVGNILTCMTLKRGTMAKMSAIPYTAALCISDTGFLLYLLPHWLHYLGVKIFSVGLGGWCQAMILWCYVCTFTATWICVCLSFDRFIIINLPRKFSRIATPFRARIAATGVVIVSVVVYLNISVLYAERTISNTMMCLPHSTSAAHTMQVLEKLDASLNLILPHLTMWVLSTGTLVALMLQYRRRRIMIRTNDNRSRSVNFERRPKAEMQYTQLTLALCFTFLWINLPPSIMRLYFYLGVEMSPTYLLWQNVFITVSYSRSALNFPLHFMFSKCFRRVFRLWLSKPKKKKYIPSRHLAASALVNGFKITAIGTTAI